MASSVGPMSWVDAKKSLERKGRSQAAPVASAPVDGTPFDLRDRSLNYTYSDFDRRHVFQGTYTYELPFGRGKRFLSGVMNLLMHYLYGLTVREVYLPCGL